MTQPAEDVLDVYDSEVAQIGKIIAYLNDRAKTKSLSYTAFEREISDKFAEAGFTVAVSWYEFGVEGTPGAVPGAAMPEITITGRISQAFRFDPDRQVHEVTSNVLEIPGEGGVIKTSPGEMRAFMDQAHHKH